ncbi:unnamed protein product [Lathyrus sativus]|nr:unnamed protein product [Lathyrus sativus]
MGKEHVIEDAYMTDELDSGSDDDSRDERPYVIRFNQEEYLSKDFVFKVGMEFSSLRQFKDAILEHNVLNGMDVKFEKSDANRCRIKTLFAKHKCGRHFFNKSAKVEWVPKVIVDGLKNNSRMRLSEVVADVKQRYTTKISGCRAFKARHIARHVVEGDYSKQFSLL